MGAGLQRIASARALDGYAAAAYVVVAVSTSPLTLYCCFAEEFGFGWAALLLLLAGGIWLCVRWALRVQWGADGVLRSLVLPLPGALGGVGGVLPAMPELDPLLPIALAFGAVAGAVVGFV